MAPKAREEEAKTAPPSAIHRVVREASKGPGWTMRLEYPTFSALDAPTAKIRAFVEAAKSDFVTASVANDRAWAATASPAERGLSRPPHEMIVKWKASSLGPRWLSLELHRYWWVGGAHGEDEILSVNYDISAGRFLDLVDILPPSASPLEEVAKLARSELLRRFSEIPGIAPWIERGTAPISSNYACFTFDEGSITIHFARYQVGPGSNGLVDVLIPRRPKP